MMDMDLDADDSPKNRKKPGITVADLVPFDDAPHYSRLRNIGKGGTLRFEPPRFVGDDECLDTFESSIITELEVEQPQLSVNQIFEAVPLPASNIILHEGQALHHRYFEPERDVCMLERFGLMMVDPEARRIAMKPKFHPVRMPKALSLLSQCGGNYAHFLAEVLPKLLLADEYGVDRDAPILLDDGWSSPNHMKLVRLYNRHNRKIIRVGREQAADVHHLFDISPTAYAPPEYRWFVEGGEMESTPGPVYRFSREALDMVRNGQTAKDAPVSKHGAKLFLGRKVTENSTGRELINMHHLAHMASERGFQAINTGDMSALEQIATFRAARVIIAPIGASLSNLIFTPPGCEVICLSPIYKKANYYYFAKLLAALGHKLTYVVGPQVPGGQPHPFHRNYVVDEEHLDTELDRIKPRTSRRWFRR